MSEKWNPFPGAQEEFFNAPLDQVFLGRNAAPTKVQCAECHWLGLSTDLTAHTPDVLSCPICNSPFARYPQRAEHLWSDPY